MEQVTKVCTKCKVVKLLCEFYKNKLRPDGLGYYCKECARKRTQEHYQGNSGRIKEHARKYYESNSEKLLARQKKYKTANPEKTKAKMAKYFKAHRDKLGMQQKTWRKNNPEKIKEIDMRCFAKKTLKKELGCSIDEVNQYPELIEMKIAIIKLNRVIKQVKK